MCSQSGNISDLAGHSPSCMIGSDTEPDSSRQDYANPPPLSSDMSLRYMHLPSTDDVRFNPDSGTSSSPVYSSEPSAVQNTSSPTPLAFSPYSNIFQPTSLNGSTFPSLGGSYPSFPTSSYLSMPDIKPRLNSMNASPSLAPITRSPALPHPGSPISTRDLYTGATPHLRRTSDLLYRSPSSNTRHPHSPTGTTSGFASPISNMDSTSLSQQCPPLFPTEVIYQLQAPDGAIIKPEIYARIDKGFFMADNDWTCYRRNYFSLNCSYTLQPHLPTGMPHLIQHGSQGPQIQQFAMCIAAVVDGREGKPIELVQHTPKRDKGPQDKPSRVTLQPRPPPSHSLYGSSPDHGSNSIYSSQSFGASSNQTATEATFERIQFKNATANNGKRRAAQQYYHLLVELFADVGNAGPERWVKIATRMSAQMVVRGRSPGHYQSERRGSTNSNGGSGPSGYSGSSRGGGSSHHGGDVGMGGMGGGSVGSAFGSGFDARGGHSHHHYRSAGIPSLQIPLEPTLSPDEEKSINGSEQGYFYHAAGIWENPPSGGWKTEHDDGGGGGNSGGGSLGSTLGSTLSSLSHLSSRYHLPNLNETRPSHHQYKLNSSYVLPSLDGGLMGRSCGRWDAVAESKGYFPPAALVSELNIT